MLKCFSNNYFRPIPAGGRPAVNQWAALAQRAQAIFVRDGIIELTRPHTKATTSLSLARFIRGYIRRGNLDHVQLKKCVAASSQMKRAMKL